MKNSLRSFTVWAGLLIAVLAGLWNLAGGAVSTEPRSAIPTVTASASIPAGQASNIQHPVSSTQPALGDRLLMEAASRLARRRSVIARLRHQVFIHDEHLFGVGYYWQEGRGDDLKVRLELQIAGQDSRLLQVSNSRFQWLDRSFPTGRTVSRVDLRQLRAVLAAENGNEVRPGEASWSPIHSDFTANCGGLPRLLAALTENFSFLPPQAMRLVPAQGSGANGVPFFAVVGRWKPEKLAALSALRNPPLTADNRLPTSEPQATCHKKCCCSSTRPNCSLTASSTAQRKLHPPR